MAHCDYLTGVSRRWLLTALMVVTMVLGGCETQRVSYDQPSAAQDEAFGAAVGRPPTARTLYAMAKLLRSKGREDEAVYVLSDVIAKHPDFQPAYVTLAELHVRHRRPDAAMQVLELGVSRTPNDPVLLNNLGMCLLLKNRAAEALEMFDRAHKIDPVNARYVTNQATALGVMGRYEEALRTYQQVIPHGEALYNVGVHLQANGEAARAQEIFREAQEAGYLDRAEKQSAEPGQT